MDFYFDTKIFLQSISVLVSLFMIIFFILKGKKTPLLYNYLWCQIIIFIWSFGHILFLFSNNLTARYISIYFQYLAISFVGSSWLLFCLIYTFSSFLKKRKLIYFMFLPPILVYITLLTNTLHNKFYLQFTMDETVYGPFFWIHLGLSYLYVLIGTILLIRYSIMNIGYARKRTFILIFAAITPTLANIFYIVNAATNIHIIPKGYDPTPVSFAISLLLFSIAMFKYRFLNIVPIAFRKIVYNLNESIIVVDSLNRIDNFNKSFLDTFSTTQKIRIYDDIETFTKYLKSTVSLTAESEKLINAINDTSAISESGQIDIISPQKKSFRVNIQPLFGKKQDFLGRIILFNDITDYKNLLDEVNDKNAELTAMNQQLSEYAATVEELSIAKERNRFAKDVHDTLGHSMTLLISLLEVSNITCKKSPEKTEEKLSQALNVAREGLKELRRSIKGLAPENLKNSDILSSIKSLTKDFEPSGVNIDFSHNIENIDINPRFSSVIFRICQEALTNSLRHGKAKNVTIILRAINNKIELFIFDDGIGCSKLKKGFGLTSMTQRVKDIGGSIVFGSDGESGFNIRLKIPLD
ncbi:histidine kinase N-terminal 7TM domain-containing protein [Herbivorax sp. ANBcel31]|uniref:sensor histidine kinase n=1 Tax=Herbivorax sp. ANBcel31 TaxID=3069754 RepID=UPI0027B61E90|nr:histidine kinase N-terminal 7TM domain-containing protein [Herbivorax sp. ANBcel31]MDQ2085413.1 histidine kinase N-terminal 7TM domain-containing protein [Herbivorax sp. ANBcel31]